MNTPVATSADIASMADLPYLPPTRRFVILALLATFLVFFVCTGVLIYRGLTSVDPRSVIFVVGDESCRGADISISGGPLIQPLHAQLGDYNKFQVPFFLAPGNYVATVRHPAFNDEEPFFIAGHGVQLMLTVRANNPATQSAR